VFGATGVNKDERAILRRHGWHGGQGTRAEAAAYMVDSASPALLVPPGVDLEQSILDLPKPEPKPEPLLKLKAEAPREGHRAAFLVATHNRPNLLAASLRHLTLQRVPKGWSVEILVAGQPGDLGAQVVALVPNAKFIPVKSAKVTDKLNHLAKATQADLLLMADDDDLQPPNRLEAAVRAFERGGAWSASGVHRFFHLQNQAMARWEGKAITGFVGTSVSITRELFLRAGGYPSVASGKDGHLAYRIRQLKGENTRFTDISSDIGEGLICIQHKANINTRPFPKKDQRTVRGKFSVTGEGSWEDVVMPTSSRQTLVQLLSGAEPCPVQKKRVSTIMAGYKAAEWIGKAVRSVLAQRLPEGWSLELLIGVDGCDETFEAVRHLKDPRVRVFRMDRNYGTYITANTLIAHSSGELLARVDADDKVHPDRMFDIIQAMEARPELARCNTYYRDVDRQGRPLQSTAKAPAGVWVYRRSAWDEHIGGFHPWPCAADGELRHRARALDLPSFLIPRPLYIRRVHNTQLSSHPDTKPGSTIRDKAWVEIQKYRVAWKRGDPVQRVEAVTGKFRVEVQTGPPSITVSVASIGCRRASLEKVVAQLLPQVDRLNAYLNNYPDIPLFLKHPKITVARSQDHGDHGDAGKMFWAGEVQGYHLTVDDDIFYPDDYVAKSIAAIEKYDRKVVIGWHGCILKQPFKGYYQQHSRHVFHFRREVPVDVSAHIVGTGTACYHTDTIKVARKDFKHPNMADIWFGLLGQEQKVPFMVVAHARRWLDSLPDSQEQSIWEASIKKRGGKTDTGTIQTQTVKNYGVWNLQRTGLQVLMIGRYGSKSLRTGGIGRSCFAISKDLIDFGDTVTECPTPEDLPPLDKFDVAMIYCGWPTRPDGDRVPEHVKKLRKAGIPTIVMTPYRGPHDESTSELAKNLRAWNRGKGVAVYGGVFTHAAEFDPKMKGIPLIVVPKTIRQAPPTPVKPYEARSGVCLGELSKIHNERFTQLDLAEVIAKLNKALPGVPIIAYRQYGDCKAPVKGLTIVPSATYPKFISWLSTLRVMVVLTRRATYEMVPLESQGVGTPVVYPPMPQSLDTCVGDSGLRFNSVDQLVQQVTHLYQKKNLWQQYSQAGRANAKAASSSIGAKLHAALEEITHPMKFDPKAYWETRYSDGGNSGSGSAGAEAEWKIKQVVRLSRGKVRSILDLGIGDGTLTARLMEALTGVIYHGVDLTPTGAAIARRNAPGATVAVLDITREKLGRKADVSLCLDVLFHIPEKAAHDAAVLAACQCASQFTVITTWNEGIVKKYKGRFGEHTFFHPLKAPEGYVIREQIPLPMESCKTMYVIQREVR
jgi:glycosyltransferase involved in cell wall biosynthesis